MPIHPSLRSDNVWHFESDSLDFGESSYTACPSRALSKVENTSPSGTAPNMSPKHRLYDMAQVSAEKRALLHNIKDQEELKQRKALLDELQRSGEFRELASIGKDWRQKMDELATDLPNFNEVVDYFRACFALAEFTSGVPHLEPMLLDGPPGAGKTYFVEKFAKWLDSGFELLRMENAQTNAQLVGSDESYGNAKPGLVFNALVHKSYANPVFLLDEIEKASGDNRYNPISPLYSLFENETAKTFKDLAIPRLTLDASKCIWICTSNDYGLLPSPIQSRVRRFDIAAPTADQSRHIARNVFKELVDALPEALRHFRLADDALDAVLCLSPREIKKALREGVARAVYRRQAVVSKRDLPIHRVNPNRSIGFA